MQTGFTGQRKVVEDIALLESQCLDDREHALDEATADLAVGAKAKLPPDDRMTNDLLGVIVRRLDAFVCDEGEEGMLCVEDFAAHPGDLLRRAMDPLAQEIEDLALNRKGVGSESRPTDCSVFRAVPVFEQSLAVVATHSHDFCLASHQPVSSASTTAAALTA